MLNLTAADATPPPGSKQAKYRRLANAIATQISDGHLQPGENLPGSLVIAEMTGVARTVVTQALYTLEREGTIERRNGVPARVPPAPAVREISMDRYTRTNVAISLGERPDSSAFAEGHGIGWDDFTIDYWVSREPATPKDRDLLNLPAGAWVWRRSFVKYAAGEPVEFQRSALPEFVVEGNSWLVDAAFQPYRGGTQWEMFDAGHTVRAIEQTSWARLPTEEEERLLRIRNQAVCDVERVMLGEKNRPVEASRLVLPGSKHRLVEQVTLRKVDPGRSRRLPGGQTP